MHRHKTIQFMITCCIIIMQTLLTTEAWAQDGNNAPGGGHVDWESFWVAAKNTFVFICIAAIPVLHAFFLFTLLVIIAYLIRLRCNEPKLSEDDNSMIIHYKNHQLEQGGDVYNV